MQIADGDIGDPLREIPEFRDLRVNFFPPPGAQLMPAILQLHIAAHDLVVLLSGQCHKLSFTISDLYDQGNLCMAEDPHLKAPQLPKISFSSWSKSYWFCSN